MLRNVELVVLGIILIPQSILAINVWTELPNNTQTYYITPSVFTPCLNDSTDHVLMPCITLSQFASKYATTNNYSGFDISLILMEGNHTLESTLLIKNAMSFMMVAISNSPTGIDTGTEVTCSKTAWLEFDSITENVTISGIHFIGCVDNTVRFVQAFYLSLSTFQNQGVEKTSLQLVSVSQGKIYAGYFTFTDHVSLELLAVVVGGGIVVNSSNVVIEESLFEGNMAVWGGAMYSQNSNVTIKGSIFRRNIVTSGYYGYGGAIYADSSVVTILDSIFFQNAIIHSYYGFGGAVYVKNVDSFIAKNTTFYNNVVISEYPSGGAMFSYLSKVNVNESAFINNVVHASGTTVSGGGAVYATLSEITVLSTLFQGNLVISYSNGGGGALFILYNRILHVYNSTFTNNSVRAVNGYGGALYAQNSNMFRIVLNNCTLIENSVSAINGTGFGGAIECEASYILLVKCTLARNYVIVNTGGGGVLNSHELSSIVLQSCTCVDNYVTATGDGFGGVVYATDSSEVEIHDSLFNNNTVFGDEEVGGAVYSDSSTVIVQNSTFSQNTVTGGGGAIYTYNSVLTVNSTTLYSNQVAYMKRGSGGAVYTELSNATLLFNTFISNIVTNINGTGAALYSNFSKVIMINNTFIKNTVIAELNGGGGALCAYSSSIKLDHCTFMSNSVTAVRGYGGALCIAMASNITINSSSFLNNSVTSNFVATGGAVDVEHSSINVTASSFEMNNVASHFNSYGGALSTLSSTVISRYNVFNKNSVSAQNFGRGGGLYVEFKTLLLSCDTFTYNHASGIRNGYGGAMFFWSTNVTSTGGLNIHYNQANTSVLYALRSNLSLYENTNISNNFGSIYAYSANIKLLGYTQIRNNTYYTTQELSQEFEGGGITSFQGNIFLMDEVDIMCNTAKYGGGIAATESKVYMHGNITIIENVAEISGGGIFSSKSELNFNGNTVISANRASFKGGGVHNVGSSTNLLGGSLRFVANSAYKGGAMGLDLNAKLYILKTSPEFFIPNTSDFLTDHIQVEFANNTAHYGGALYVTDTYSDTCASTHSDSSECFFQALALYTPDITTQNVEGNYVVNILNVHFFNNLAVVSGSILHGGLLDRCVVSPFAEIYNGLNSTTVQSSTTYISSITNIRQQDYHDKSRVSSDPIRVCFCKFNQPDCSYKFPEVKVKKGETFPIPIAAVDQVNNTVSATIRGYLASRDSGLGEGETSQHITDKCTTLNYTAFSPHDTEKLFLYAIGPCNNTGMSQNKVSIHFLPCTCPIGFEIKFNRTNCTCGCDPQLSSYVTSCFASNSSLLKESNAWIGFINTTDYEGFILNSHCPFDYCSAIKTDWYIDLTQLNGADKQCAFNRTGILCGSCKDGLSLSLGSSHCIYCSNSWLALLSIFALAGVLLVAFILIFNLTVAVGTINGLTLYANIVSTHYTVYYPSNKENILTIFIAWLNLDFGFRTCFFNGMDSYAKVWLQLVFPCYILCLVVVVVAISKCSRRFSRLISKRNPAAALATLILLSYTKLIRIIVAALSFARLKYEEYDYEIVWLMDANLAYLEGKHIPLFIAALIIVVVGAVYTSLLVSWQWLQRISHKRGFKWIVSTRIYPFIDACHAPFSPKHRYWFGLLLLVRILLYLISAVNVQGDPKTNLLATLCIVGILLLVNNPSGKVYKKWPLNCLESLYLFNITIFTSSTLYLRDSHEQENHLHAQAVLFNVSVSIAFATYVLIIIYHGEEFLFKQAVTKYVKDKLTRKLCAQRSNITDEQFHNQSRREKLPTCSYMEIDVCQLRNVHENSKPRLQHQSMSIESTLSEENSSALHQESATTDTSGYATSDYFTATASDTCPQENDNDNAMNSNHKRNSHVKSVGEDYHESERASLLTQR